MADEIALPSEPTVKARGPRLAAEKAFPTVGAEQLVRIIKGYAVASNGGQDQVNYKDVASATGLNPTVVSGNNTFLAESEIIVSPKYGYYVPSEEAVRFAREAAWDEENAKSHLRGVALATWYGQVTVQNFATRSALSRDELRRVLGIKSGATEADAKGLNNIIDFLIYLEIVMQGEDESLRRGNTDEFTKEAHPGAKLSGSLSFPVHSDITPAPDRVQDRPGERSIAVVLNLNVSVSPRDLTPENAQLLRDWITSLMKQEE